MLGDFFYSPPDIYKKSRRLLLHAEELHVNHPRTKQRLIFTTKCPFTLSEYDTPSCEEVS